ncbi:CrpP-related protein [Achromobacter sp. JD-1]|uniref:CrpP-related protein n=1 Tax=unclassified Achromobacter TaxID=2626865 RepID=UPI002714E785|nr:CrpP-related protein [Achromobacter sp. MY14]
MRPDIQEEGAVAARAGLSLWDCPYYRAGALTGQARETLIERRLKMRAWELGWLSEKTYQTLSDCSALRILKWSGGLSWRISKKNRGSARGLW